MRGQMRAPDWALVHGTVIVVGCTIAHAWLELGGKVYDAVKDQVFDLADYYREHGAVAHARFTPREAAKMALQTGVYGPWKVAA
jgi:hypothetical protein